MSNFTIFWSDQLQNFWIFFSDDPLENFEIFFQTTDWRISRYFISTYWRILWLFLQLIRETRRVFFRTVDGRILWNLLCPIEEFHSLFPVNHWWIFWFSPRLIDEIRKFFSYDRWTNFEIFPRDRQTNFAILSITDCRILRFFTLDRLTDFATLSRDKMTTFPIYFPWLMNIFREFFSFATRKWNESKVQVKKNIKGLRVHKIFLKGRRAGGIK